MTIKDAEGMKKKPVEPGKIEINAVSVEQILTPNENERYELVHTNMDTVISSEVNSQELHEGMAIAVQDGGNPNKNRAEER